MINLLLFASAYATTRTDTVEPWAIKSTLAPRSLYGGDHEEHQIRVCPVTPGTLSNGDNAGEGCSASDGGQLWTSSWSYVKCYTVLEVLPVSATNPLGTDYILLYAIYDGPVDGSGYSILPTNWPSYVDCGKQIGSNPAHIHAYRLPITNAPSGQIRSGGEVTTLTSTANLVSTGVTVSVPSTWVGNGLLKNFNIENGTWSGAGVTEPTQATTTAGGSTFYSGVACHVKEPATDDYLGVLVAESAPTGTAYCKLTLNGVTKNVKIIVVP